METSDLDFIQNLRQVKKAPFKGNIFKCQFNLQQYNDNLVFPLLGQKIDLKLCNAVSKRKAEFVAGRYMAKFCLEQHGISATHLPIGANRAPVWPHNIIGSITHTNHTAICATAEKSAYRYLGIDVEAILSEQTAQQIAGAILVSNEHHLVSALDTPDTLILTLIFPVKESLFKALYPDVQQYFDFDAAQVLEIDFTNQKIQLELVKSLTTELLAGTHFTAYFDVNEQQVFTLLFSAQPQL
ncbi:4'-phosphopantetheinyl transferase superfamily protein [Pseudoalteromonas tunicata]|uniref:4'-phosphopantetheinyl transferase family protein n=1 Tax=Pseudoalteromonas tunicata TaxID=314281 RepID=UPI0027400A5F|nr:4'-phosphopantetheinyl transferase superfamily protein [Pseudoalteromonas tunicata]MDP5215403.1 4'-phosphopantetheinyl transferase superfamily protein [Pseudoalteromonas tunicata]